MTNRFSSTTLARWTAVFLVISTVFFALAVLMERSGKSRETPAASEQLEAGESGEENSQAEGSHVEGAGTEASGEESETILGINLENPWIVWGFVSISLLWLLPYCVSGGQLSCLQFCWQARQRSWMCAKCSSSSGGQIC